MEQHQWLAEQFEANRSHLQAVAYRMLGSLAEANDAVQESWLNLTRTDATTIQNLGGWLTTVVAHICLDMLRSRKSRPEESLDDATSERIPARETDPEQEALLADSVGLAMLVVLDTLTPAERLAFVLHDVFALPFEDIAPVLERSEAATRQLASRARRRIQGTAVTTDTNLAEKRAVVEAFLAASREGSFDALLAVLDPDAVFRADAAAVMAGAKPEVHGATKIGQFFVGRAQTARPVLINGSVGVMVAPYGRLLLVLQFTVNAGKIAEIRAVADPIQLHQLHLAILPD